MNKAQQLIQMFTYYKTPHNVAMGMLDFFCKQDGFNGWVLEDDSRINFVDGEFVEVKK